MSVEAPSPAPALAPIWQPSAPPSSIPMNQYRSHINKKFNLNLQDSRQLQQWSVTAPQEFWVDLWSYVGLVPDLAPGTKQAYDPEIPMTEVPPFFENAVINYAENVLTQPDVAPDSPALIGIREGQGLDGERWSWMKLREEVRRIRSALKRSGVKEGDRVAALISTSIWSVTIFLACASLGAIYTSVASDFGTEVSLDVLGRNMVELRSLNIVSGVHFASSVGQSDRDIRRQPRHLQGPPTFEPGKDFGHRGPAGQEAASRPDTPGQDAIASVH